MICIYHSRDLDGYTSGFIVKRKYPEAKLIGYDYGKPIPWDQIPAGEPVIMIDVSLGMTDMLKMALHSGDFTWIDHHISAINEFNATVWPREMKAVLENGISACEGGWKYLFPNEPMPEAIKLLGEYDTWRNQDKERWEQKILPFQFGMRMYCSSPETFPFQIVEQGGKLIVNNIIEEGLTVLKYQAQVNEKACHGSFEIEFDGLRAICLNGGGFNSDVFKSVYNPEKHDVMIPFYFNGKEKFWTVSLYTTHEHVDCSVIAKAHGGGGHKKAAGFQVEDISTIIKK